MSKNLSTLKESSHTSLISGKRRIVVLSIETWYVQVCLPSISSLISEVKGLMLIIKDSTLDGKPYPEKQPRRHNNCLIF